MWKALGWVHSKLYWGVLWLLALPPRAIWAFILAVLMLLGEEFRRWASLAVSGTMIYLAGKATINYAPPSAKQPLAITVLVLFAIWALAVKRAAHYTMHNNLRLVRQRMWFREIAGGVRTLRQDVGRRIAQATWGTPAQGAFRSNRERAHREIEQEQRSRRQADEEERRRDELADLEPSPY